MVFAGCSLLSSQRPELPEATRLYGIAKQRAKNWLPGRFEGARLQPCRKGCPFTGFSHGGSSLLATKDEPPQGLKPNSPRAPCRHG